METNALMGKNVARLIVDNMASGGSVKARDGEPWGEQRVLKYGGEAAAGW